MEKTVGKKIAAKPDKTQEEADMLDLMQHGGDHVSAGNLEPVIRWLETQK